MKTNKYNGVKAAHFYTAKCRLRTLGLVAKSTEASEQLRLIELKVARYFLTEAFQYSAMDQRFYAVFILHVYTNAI